MAGGFAAGSAMLVPVEVRHDPRTAHVLADYRARRQGETDAEVLAAAARLDRPEAARHPLCAEFRQIVDAELAARDLTLAALAPAVRIKQCCGAVLEGEVCDCEAMAAELAAAPVIWLGGAA